MALLKASQSGLFLTAGADPAMTQSFGGTRAGVMQHLSVPSASGLWLLPCSLLDCARARSWR